LSERRREILFFAAIFVLLAYSFPYFEKIHSANELPRVYLTHAMIEDGTFAIDRGVKRWGRTADMSPSGGHTFSNKAPGSSFLAIPGYLVLKAVKGVSGEEPSLAEMTWVARFTTGVLPTFLFLLLLYRFLARYWSDRAGRRLVVSAYALGTMAMTYSVLFISHQISAVCIGVAYIVVVWVVEEERPGWWMLLAGLAAGAAPLMDYQAAFAGIPIAAYACWHLLWRQRRWSTLGWALLGAALPIALLLYYHDAAFGSPFATGYHASKSFAHHHQRGFMGLDQFRIAALIGSTVTGDNGLLVFSPFLLFAIPGWVLMWRARDQRWAAGVTLAIVVIFVAFLSSISMWRGGWQMGPRYITVMLPFAVIPVAACAARLDGRWVLRALFVATVVTSIAIYTLSCAEYPHFPEQFKNPFYEITLRLLREGHAPYNVGWLFGLRSVWSLAPYLAVLLVLIAWLAVPSRRHLRSGLVGLTLAIAILLAYSAFPGGKMVEGAYQRSIAGAMPSP